VLDPAYRIALLGAALSWTSTGTADPILIVDGDLGESNEAAYAGALSTLGFSNTTTFTVSTGGGPFSIPSGPSASAMSGKTVIWLTGADYSKTLSATDTSNLETFLSGGGRLLQFGTDVAYDLTDGGSIASTFLATGYAPTTSPATT
jgi:hypothetical protein